MAEQGLTRERHGHEAASSSELAAYLDRLEDAVDEAAEAAGGYRDAALMLAGRAVRLRFAGEGLMPRLLPALAHVRSEPVPAALTIRLFDSTSTGAGLPPAPWPDEAYADSGKVRASLDGKLNGVFESRRFSVFRPEQGRGLYWVRDPEDIDYGESGSPLQTILQLWLAARGIQLAHAGAVGRAHGCVMIVGKGGAGKSSTVLACLPSELGVIGDDYCLLGPEDPPVVHTVYSSAKAHDDTLARLQFLRRMVTNPERSRDDKALCMLHPHAPDKLLARAPLRAVVIPRVTGRPETTMSPATPAAALAGLAPSTLLQLQGAGAPALARLARAVRAVPCHFADLGTDPTGIARAIGSLLER